MAGLYPQYSEKDFKCTPFGEGKVYKALQDQLGDSFLIFHALSWIYKEKGSNTQDYEADFVVFHPSRQVLVIEVKGGVEISHDPKEGKWYSTNRKGKHGIKDPYKQAKRNKYGLRGYVSGRKEWTRHAGKRLLPVHYATFFPDLDSIDSLEGPDSPAGITGSSSSLDRLDCWMKSVLEYWEGEGETCQKLTQEGYRAIEEIFTKEREARMLVSTMLEEEEAERVKLTDEKAQILQWLGLRKRVSISGGAGTGKTLIAFQKARQLASSGVPTLFVCYNQLLAEHLKRVNDKPDLLYPMTFHELCEWRARSCYKATGHDVLKEAREAYPDENIYNVQLPFALALSTEYMEEKFDAIIVDEGQDFKEGYWLPLEMLLQCEETSHFYILYDENQTIYHKPKSFPIKDEPFRLTRNCRNTNQIFKTFIPYYAGSPIVPPTRDGGPVNIIEAPTLVQQSKKVCSRIQELIGKEKVPPSDIAVLCLDDINIFHDRLKDFPLPDGAIWLKQDYPSRNTVLIETAKRFKGMEAPVIFVVGCGSVNLEQEKELIYVTLSRAKSLLYLVGKREACEDIILGDDLSR